jgi:uncharacterized membrane protein YdbT with pleckstrin-like domain
MLKQYITDTGLPRGALLKKLLAGRVLVYRRSFLDYLHWWVFLVLVLIGILSIYILDPTQPRGLPFEWFAPLAILGVIIHKKYNRKYVISNKGIAFKSGYLSLKLSEQALSFSKLRAVEVNRNLLQRILNLGDVGVDTILGDEPELFLRGIFKPAELAAVIDYFIAKKAEEASQSGGVKPADERHTALYAKG